MSAVAQVAEEEEGPMIPDDRTFYSTTPSDAPPWCYYKTEAPDWTVCRGLAAVDGGMALDNYQPVFCGGCFIWVLVGIAAAGVLLRRAWHKWRGL